MAFRHSAVRLSLVARLFILFGSAAMALPAQTSPLAQADSSRSPDSRTAPPPSKSAAGTPAVRALFQKHCAKCHDKDGKGGAARGLFPEIPDFTKVAWQQRRSDAQFRISILEGKGTGMPSLRGKITKSQARDLAGFVRTFAPTAKKNAKEPEEKPAPDRFDDHFQRLQHELDELQRQFRNLSQDSANKKGSSADRSSTRPAAYEPSSPAAATPADRELFQRHCVRCHGRDGTGSNVRRRQPEIPNFTDPDWQALRSDAQLRASILDGKGKKMPSWREKITARQALGLVARVRAFSAPADPPRR